MTLKNISEENQGGEAALDDAEKISAENQGCEAALDDADNLLGSEIICSPQPREKL